MIPGIFTAKRCLDIGSNAGDVSCKLVFDYQAASVTGVDIDPELVAQARKQLALRASRVRPATELSDRVVDYYPISAVLSHGYRIEPEDQAVHSADTASANAQWPLVKFCAADWVVTGDRELVGPYDVILALSLIKWIHLEHLDAGLLAFFAKCSAALSPGGFLVIELQPWKSYEVAVRPGTAPHFQDNFAQLKYRPDDFDKILADLGLHVCASTDVLPRRITVYRKAPQEPQEDLNLRTNDGNLRAPHKRVDHAFDQG